MVRLYKKKTDRTKIDENATKSTISDALEGELCIRKIVENTTRKH